MKYLATILVSLLMFVRAANAVFPNVADTSRKAVGRVGSWNGMSFTTSGSAIAISPTRILTVAHVGGSHFEQDGVVYPVLNKVFHAGAGGVNADLAIWEVAGPVRYAAPMSFRPFSGANGLLGAEAILVGYGITGNRVSTGWQLLGGTQGTRRSARNVIDFQIQALQVQISAGVFKTSDCIFFDLDDPLGQSTVNVTGGPAIPGEGGIADLDSGGSFMVLENGRERAVGTSAYVGTLNGTGVVNWWDFGGVGGAVHLFPYAGWIQANTPDLGRAILEGMSLEFGSTVVSGTLGDLNLSDDQRLNLQSPNLAEGELLNLFGLIVNANTTASPASQIDLRIEGRVNASLATCEVALRNWSTGTFQVVHVYFLTPTEATETILSIPGANYVRTDGAVDVRLRLTSVLDDIVFARPSFDMVRIDAR